MPVTSFKEARRQHAESGRIFGNVSHFGETVTYRPAGGGGERQIDVTIASVELDFVSTEFGENQKEMIWVKACRDLDCTRGGIDTPARGDVILRADDAPDAPWTFKGSRQNVTPAEHELLFGRIRPTRYGPQRER